jgi:branched-chain amino acid transport system substrate-binding protein
MKTRTSVAAFLAAFALSLPAYAADPIKLGIVTTLTTPSASQGREVVDALNLAIEQIGGTIAGHPVQLVVEDDGTTSELARQKAEKLVREGDIDIIAGFNFTNTLLAARKPVLDAHKILFSLNPGPSDLAGKLCNPLFLSIRSQTNVAPAQAAKMLDQAGIKTVYTMAPNYAASKDVVGGMVDAYKGKIVGSALTKWGDDPQMDFSAELANAKASGAEAIYAFFPAAPGAAFARQFDQAGLTGQMKLYTIWTIDQLSLPQLQAAKVNSVLGSIAVEAWVQDLPFPANRKFVDGFKAKYGRLPSNYAAQAYDFILATKAGIEKSGGDPHAVDKIAAQMHKADYDSIRGPFHYSINGMPVNPFYAEKVVALPDGTWTWQTVDKISDGEEDPFVKDCKLGQ